MEETGRQGPARGWLCFFVHACGGVARNVCGCILPVVNYHIADDFVARCFGSIVSFGCSSNVDWPSK